MKTLWQKGNGAYYKQFPPFTTVFSKVVFCKKNKGYKSHVIEKMFDKLSKM